MLNEAFLNANTEGTSPGNITGPIITQKMRKVMNQTIKETEETVTVNANATHYLNTKTQLLMANTSEMKSLQHREDRLETRRMEETINSDLIRDVQLTPMQERQSELGGPGALQSDEGEQKIEQKGVIEEDVALEENAASEQPKEAEKSVKNDQKQDDDADAKVGEHLEEQK